MTATWNPCEEGQRLYEVYCHEADEVRKRGYYTLDPDQPILVAMREWESHRDSCEKCRIAKETK